MVIESQITELKNNIDLDIIRLWEGGCQLKSYVPPIGRSGVTIATGIDLGQQDAASFYRSAVSSALIDKCRPYFGVKGDDAQSLNKKNPLILTQEEANELDFGLMNKYYDLQKDLYVKSATVAPVLYASRMKWEEVPKECRTVMLSLGWNMGTSPYKSYPRAWHLFCKNQWENLQRELNNFGHTAYALQLRRQREAKYLEAVTGTNPMEPVAEPYPWPYYVKKKLADKRKSSAASCTKYSKSRGRRAKNPYDNHVRRYNQYANTKVKKLVQLKEQISAAGVSEFELIDHLAKKQS